MFSDKIPPKAASPIRADLPPNVGVAKENQQTIPLRKRY